MELLFASDLRFTRYPDGSVYSQDGTMTNGLIQRYLKVFDSITIMARILDMNYDEKKYPEDRRIDGEKVTVAPLPFYLGPYQYIKQRIAIGRCISKEILPGRGYICRVPSTLGTILADKLAARKIPYAVEVVGDPYDVFAPGVVKHLFRPIFRHTYTKSLKRIVWNSSAALYVTNTFLQSRYPVREGIMGAPISDVVLSDSVIAEKAKIWSGKKPIELIAVGSLEQMYKSPDIVIKAIAKLHSKGLNCRLTWLGGGVFLDDMVALARKLNLQEQVNFPGRITPFSKVMAYLDKADIFLIPSRTEGLPRALVEAMARGLPCIASSVGGMLELLDEASIVPPNNIEALADKICYFVDNKDFLNDQAERNLAVAANYRDEILAKKRTQYYEHVMKITKETENKNS